MEKDKTQWENRDNGSINPINGFHNINSGPFVTEKICHLPFFSRKCLNITDANLAKFHFMRRQGDTHLSKRTAYPVLCRT